MYAVLDSVTLAALIADAMQSSEHMVWLEKVSKQGGVGGPVALASGYENTYPLPNRPE